MRGSDRSCLTPAAPLVAVAIMLAGVPPAAAQGAPSQLRAERRAYAGAPPAMPHPPLGAACISCHGGDPIHVEGLGLSPASPHRNEGQMGHCRQCHVAVETSGRFRANEFSGLRPGVERGRRAHPLAPPTIPHRVFMRENCLACHGGPAARPEFRTSHEDRVHCRQCHLPSITSSATAAVD